MAKIRLELAGNHKALVEEIGSKIIDTVAHLQANKADTLRSYELFNDFYFVDNSRVSVHAYIFCLTKLVFSGFSALVTETGLVVDASIRSYR